MEIKINFWGFIVLAIFLFTAVAYLKGNTNMLLLNGFALITVTLLAVIDKINELIAVAKEN